jgi:hypothetical protein
MAQVSIGQVENLEDLLRGLLSVRESLAAACHEQIAVAALKCQDAREETELSQGMLEQAAQHEQAAKQAVDDAQQALDASHGALDAAESSLSACLAQPVDEDGTYPECAGDHAAVARAQAAVEQAHAALSRTLGEFERATEHRQSMEHRVDLAKQAQTVAAQVAEHAQQECNARLAAVDQAIEIGAARVRAAQQALGAYLATNPPAAQFHAWLTWNPALHGAPITPDTLRDRMNLSSEHRRMLQQYLYERNPAYRTQVDKYRKQWTAAQGDAERNILARKARIHLSGEFGEQIARHALAPLGGRIETQGRTFVGDNGRYTKTDLLVSDLRVPVILGRGEGMAAPMGGSMAFEVKCGKADYLYAQMDHMVFQAEGHKQADAQCTLCSRDIHDLPPEKEKALRDALRAAGSPMVGMLPKKNEIDQSCLEFIRDHGEGQT